MDLATILQLAQTDELRLQHPIQLKVILEVLFTELRAMEEYEEYPEQFEFDLHELLRVTYYVKKLPG